MAPVKAILKACHIEHAVVVETRHATPVQLSHLRLNGPTGRQVVRHLVGEPPACYLCGLHDWDSVPVLAKQPDGAPLHLYAGEVYQAPPLWTADDGSPLTLAERRALAESRGPWDLWVAARGYAHANGTGRSGEPFCGALVEPAFLDVFSAAAVAWRDDQAGWGLCPLEYKCEDGSPRVDVDQAVLWTVLAQPVES